MKRLMKLSVLALAVIFMSFYVANTNVQAQEIDHGAGFVDEDGDGYNDNAPDHDGDGIPNGQDEDYQPANPDKTKRNGFVDEDGDGINDRMQDADGDGIPNCQDEDYVRPQDGTGNKYGMKAGNKNGRGKGFRGNGQKPGENFGECDGTGPKGKAGAGKGNRGSNGSGGNKTNDNGNK